jgi:hypothetical protein
VSGELLQPADGGGELEREPFRAAVQRRGGQVDLALREERLRRLGERCDGGRLDDEPGSGEVRRGEALPPFEDRRPGGQERCGELRAGGGAGGALPARAVGADRAGRRGRTLHRRRARGRFGCGGARGLLDGVADRLPSVWFVHVQRAQFAHVAALAGPRGLQLQRPRWEHGLARALRGDVEVMRLERTELVDGAAEPLVLREQLGDLLAPLLDRRLALLAQLLRGLARRQPRSEAQLDRQVQRAAAPAVQLLVRPGEALVPRGPDDHLHRAQLPHELLDGPGVLLLQDLDREEAVAQPLERRGELLGRDQVARRRPEDPADDLGERARLLAAFELVQPSREGGECGRLWGVVGVGEVVRADDVGGRGRLDRLPAAAVLHGPPEGELVPGVPGEVDAGVLAVLRDGGPRENESEEMLHAS